MGVRLTAGTSPNTTLDVNGAASFREGTALTLANGVNSNIALADYTLYRITGPTAAFSITGFGNGNDGRVLTIINATAQTMSLSHQVTSSSANQINTGGSTINLTANGVATLIYNSTLTKWVVTGTNDAASSWGLTGNSGTAPATNFLGTTDYIDLVFRTNNTEKARLTGDGYFALGSTNPVSRIHAINPNGWDSGNDYVFDDYSSGTTGSTIYLRRARGTQAAPSTAVAGDTLGRLAFDPYLSGAFSYSSGTHLSALYKGNGTTNLTNLLISTSNTERMVIDENGYVGIGTTAPTQKLEVHNGNLLISNSLVSGTGTAGELRIAEAVANGSNYTAFKAQAQAADITYTLPAAVPTVDGQVMTSTTAGVMSFANDGVTTTHGMSSPAAYGASQNNLALVATGLSVFRISASAVINITGIVAATDGRQITLINIGATNAITLTNASASSLAANRFSLKGNVNYTLVVNGGAVTLVYDGISGVWRDIARN